jgi:hypothetical protein
MQIRDLSPDLEIFNHYNTEEENQEFFSKFDEIEPHSDSKYNRDTQESMEKSDLPEGFISISQTSASARTSNNLYTDTERERGYPELDTKNTSQIYTYTVTDNVNQT